MNTGIMRAEVRALADDVPYVFSILESLCAPKGQQGICSIIAIGQGDSYIAAVAAEAAFATSGIRYHALRAQTLLDYPEILLGNDDAPLVVGISASGGTARTVEAIGMARRLGMPTLAVAGVENSPLIASADHAWCLPLMHKLPSPGIRTFQASLLALYKLSRLPNGDTVDCLADKIRLVASKALEQSNHIADFIANASSLTFAGGGPGLACASFAAAKAIEAAGLAASAQEAEDWWHIDKFRRPLDLPLVVIAPPGRSRVRALALAHAALARGNRVVIVAEPADVAMLGGAAQGLIVEERVEEPWAPLLYSVFGGSLAASLADKLERLPFCAT